MRAAIVTRAGVVEVGEWPDPRPGQGEVLVQLVAAALNRRDRYLRLDDTGETPHPSVLGSDGAGKVVEVGGGVTSPAVGDEVLLFPGVRWAPGVPGPEYRIDGHPWCVLGVPHQGTHAELIVAVADLVRPKPAGWSWEEAAALPLAGLTAWRALVTRGGLRGGSAVLITGAGSGVSTFLIQISAALGARVLVTTSSEAKLARARELGAEGGANYRDPGWPKRIRDLAPDGVDLVVDSAGAPAWQGAIKVLRYGGTLVSLGTTAGRDVQINISEVFGEQLNIHGTYMGGPDEFDALRHHIGRSSWRPVIDSTFALDEASAAHRRLDEPDRFGKVLLLPR
jgi:zinc-binding alcohol dehydrogenase/oxidoreductase